MTSLDQSFQKAFAKGRSGLPSPAIEPEWPGAAMHYGPSAIESPPADDPYSAGVAAPHADFRLQSPDWLAGIRAVPPSPPNFADLYPVAVPAAANAALPMPAPQLPPAAVVPASPPGPAPIAVAQPLPVSISLSGIVATPVAPTTAVAAKPAEPAGEAPKQLRVEAKQTIAAPHFGRGSRHGAAAARSRDASPSPAPAAAEKWAALPRFDPIWEVDRLEWPAILDTLFSAERVEWQGLIDQIARRVSAGRNLLAVAGCHPGDGATTLALGIARAAARRGMRVALIDANTESPRLGETLQLQTELGWEQALLGEKTLSETAVASLAEGVHVFPLGPECAASDVPWEDAVAEAFPLLATRHHLVVVDLGTIAADEATPVAANRLVSPSAGLALLVRDGRQAGPARAAAARRQLAAAGLELLGVVENYVGK